MFYVIMRVYTKAIVACRKIVYNYVFHLLFMPFIGKMVDVACERIM